MLCYLFACRLEDEMHEAGLVIPERKTILDGFPPYRLKRNIDTINHYVGFDVSHHVLREHVFNIIRTDLFNLFPEWLRKVAGLRQPSKTLQ